MAIYQQRRRAGLTLIEVLVALAIVALLIALLVSGVQQVREASASLACANNLRQIGLALQAHHDQQGVLPSKGGWDGKQWIASVSGAKTIVATTNYALQQTFYWGVGQPGLMPRDQTGGWGYAILPYLEQLGSYDNQAWAQTVPCYICPSRRPNLAQVAQDDSYGAYEGAGWPWAKTDYAANGYVVPARPHCLKLAGMTDGTANTLLIGEKAMDPQNYTSGTWFWDEPFFLGGPDALARQGTDVLLDAPGVPFVQNWGAAHPAGAQFLFADGSVRLLVHTTPWLTVLALLTPDEGDIPPDF